MRILLFILAAVSLTSGIQYNGLRVKFGMFRALADKEYFFHIPRTIKDAEREGWRRTERPPGRIEELVLYCYPGRIICALYVPSGFVAGLQIALPADDLVSPTFKPEEMMTKWSPPAAEGEPAREYWTNTQYYVSEKLLKAGVIPQEKNGATLQNDGVWVDDLDAKVMRIPTSEAELRTTTLYKKQNCIPNMGKHYYYNMTRETSCNKLLPWFALITNGRLIGVGFQIIGRLTNPLKGRDWFEVVNDRNQTELAVPNGPECLYELVETETIISLHIYYINDPWNLKCRGGQSYKNSELLDRVFSNGKLVSGMLNTTKSAFTV